MLIKKINSLFYAFISIKLIVSELYQKRILLSVLEKKSSRERSLSGSVSSDALSLKLTGQETL